MSEVEFELALIDAFRDRFLAEILLLLSVINDTDSE